MTIWSPAFVIFNRHVTIPITMDTLICLAVMLFTYYLFRYYYYDEFVLAFGYCFWGAMMIYHICILACILINPDLTHIVYESSDIILPKIAEVRRSIHYTLLTVILISLAFFYMSPKASDVWAYAMSSALAIPFYLQFGWTFLGKGMLDYIKAKKEYSEVLDQVPANISDDVQKLITEVDTQLAQYLDAWMTKLTLWVCVLFLLICFTVGAFVKEKEIEKEMEKQYGDAWLN